MKVLSHEVFICNFTPITKRITYSIWREKESGIYTAYKHDAGTQVQSESLQYIKMLLCN